MNGCQSNWDISKRSGLTSCSAPRCILPLLSPLISHIPLNCFATSSHSFACSTYVSSPLISTTAICGSLLLSVCLSFHYLILIFLDYLEDGGNKHLQSFSNCVSIYMASHPRQLQFFSRCL